MACPLLRKGGHSNSSAAVYCRSRTDIKNYNEIDRPIVANSTLFRTAKSHAVLEANGKVNGIGENSHPSPPQPLDQFGCRFKCITTSAKGIDVPNLIKIDSAVAALRMRERTRYRKTCILSKLLHRFQPNFAQR